MCARVVAGSADPGVGRVRDRVGHNLDSEVVLSCLCTHGQSSLQRGVHCRGAFLGATTASRGPCELGGCVGLWVFECAGH